MFEAQCPSCSATYQVDERRVPPTGLKMRCPKCGESFQVTIPGQSVPPVLGAALGLKGNPTPANRKQTMLGVPDQASPAAPPRPGAAPPRPGAGAPPRPVAPAAAVGAPPRPKRATMLGVAPATQGGDDFELASLDDDGPSELDADELDLNSGPGASSSSLDLPAPSSRAPRAAQIDLPSISPPADDGFDLDADSLDDDEFDLSSSAEGENFAELPDLPADDGFDDFGDVADLPTVGGDDLDSIPGLPVPAAMDAGLPAPARRGAPPPRPKHQSVPPSSGGIGLPDLGADLPDLGADLPDLGAGLPDLGADLPDLGADLPDLDTGLPLVGGSLPTLSGGNLPQPGGSLPSPAQSMRLPELGADAAEDDDFDLTGNDAGSADDIFGTGPTAAPKTIPPAARETADPQSFGEVNFGGGASEDDDEFDAFPTDDAGAAASGGTGQDEYGDVSLEGGDGSLDLGEELDRGPDPGPAAPRGPAAAASAVVERPAPGTSKEKASKSKSKDKKKKKGKTSSLSKGARIAIAASLLLAVGGGALAALIPDVGPYGAYFIIDQIKAGDYESALAHDIKSAAERLALDTSKETGLAFVDVERGIQRAPRYKPRAAYAAYLGFLHQLRFGAAGDESAGAQVLLNGLAEAEPATQYLELAQLAHAASQGQGEQIVAEASRHIGRSVDHAVVVGEAALQLRNGEVAKQAWTAVASQRDTARAHFGLARTQHLLGDDAAAHAEVKAALAKNPAHAGARILQASLDVSDRNKDAEIEKAMTPLAEGKDGASRGEQVDALVVLGQLHLSRARLKKAEQAFTEALTKNAGSAAAQRGLADVLYESGRYSEALTRYESALSVEPQHLQTQLGVVRCKLRLEQLDDVVKLLETLGVSHPKSSAVQYWVGNAKEAVGDKETSQKAYEKAIELGEPVPELVLAYVALTRLLGQKGNLKEADEVISQAEKRFPDDPTVYEALGELSASRGSFDDAVADYDKAIELDPENVGLHFARGIALRQARRFDEAAAEFDRVEKESADYPGLALERGNLFEASGRTEEALKAYEAALAEAPNDQDLQLRVACGKANAGQSKPAIELLKPLLDARPGSAEVNFCQGLALLSEGKDLVDARRFLQRAVSRDPTRAKYHLYVGWIALEMGDLPSANLALNEAVKLDQTLADAYWKRGELRVRQRAVIDALDDLDKALELAPSRLEAHAQKAVAYLELGKEQDAMTEFAAAVKSEVVDPFWHYRYGDLLLVNRQAEQAKVQLELAVSKAEKQPTPPVWLPQAHRLLATAIGRRPEAIVHWQAYIDAKKGTNDPYLAEAIRETMAITENMPR